MNKSAAILFANDAFYSAFAKQSFEAMRSIWSKRPTITCIHPGWEILSNRKEVLDSWKDILANSRSNNIVCKNPTVQIFGDFAVVICYEVLNKGFLTATNIFVLEDGYWKMVHHQAGPTPSRKILEEKLKHTLQ